LLALNVELSEEAVEATSPLGSFEVAVLAIPSSGEAA